MRAFVALVVVATAVVSLAGASTTNNRIPYRETCRANAQDECMDLRKFWKSPSECSSVYGGFKANEPNMHNMVLYHLEDSFKFLTMVRKLLLLTTLSNLPDDERSIKNSNLTNTIFTG